MTILYNFNIVSYTYEIKLTSFINKHNSKIWRDAEKILEGSQNFSIHNVFHKRKKKHLKRTRKLKTGINELGFSISYFILVERTIFELFQKYLTHTYTLLKRFTTRDLEPGDYALEGNN